jgi:Histone deacetylase domain
LKGIKKIAILDFDVHHGNGTEAIVRCLRARKERSTISTKLFEDVTVEKWNCRPWLDATDSENVLFLSIQGISGDGFFPGSGETTEEIEGEGEKGGIINVGLPQSRHSRLLWYQHWQKRLLPAVDRFSPDLIFFSAGFDAHALDTINGGLIGLFEEDYEWLTGRVQSIANQHCNGRVVSVLEGGYAITGERLSPFARSVASHLQGLSNPGESFFFWKKIIISFLLPFVPISSHPLQGAPNIPRRITLGTSPLIVLRLTFYCHPHSMSLEKLFRLPWSKVEESYEHESKESHSQKKRKRNWCPWGWLKNLVSPLR